MANVIGQRVLRKEDPRFLRGEGRYVDNLPFEGALRVTFVRSPYAHARINSIDTSAAKEIPGVQVFTGTDLEGLPPTMPLPPFFGIPEAMQRPFMATEIVRFAGDIVAVVVSETRAEGADAAELVAVDYDVLPAVINPRKALDDEVVVHSGHGTNLALQRLQPEQHDEKLFDDCDVVVKGTLISQRLAPSPLEPRASAATFEDGKLSAWLSTQTPHQDRDGLAGLHGLDAANVRVVGPDVGGGFGAKGLSIEDLIITWLARKLERPVRWTETRSENMVAMNQGRAQVLDFEIGGSRDGVVSAYRLHILQDSGAYPSFGGFLPQLTGLMASGVYKIPTIEFSIKAVATNTTPVGPFRGAGRPEAAQAIERAMDMFAAELGMDPAEVRRKNFIENGTFPYTTASGAIYDIGDYGGALDLALKSADYEGLRAEQKKRRDEGGAKQLGIGISCYVEITNGGGEGEYSGVEIAEDGSAIARTGSFSHGQGHETTFAQIVADRLGLPVEKVTVIKGDTAEVPRGTGTYGSKSTQIGGAAAQKASDSLVVKAKQLAADLLEANPDDLELDLDAGSFHVVGTPQPALTWAQLASQLNESGRLAELSAEEDFQPESPTFPFGTHVAIVEVDTETGRVDLRRHVAVDDAGNIINPVIAAGQVQGGVATGVFQALYEEVIYDEGGNPMTGNFVAYAFPSAADVPGFDFVEMETPTPVNSLGAKGIGESGTIGATPAVQNAVVDALAHRGIRHIDMPVNGERVWRALQGAQA